MKELNVNVVRRVAEPGQMLTLSGELGEREPTRANRENASSWVIDLGGNNVPCDRIEVDVADSEFVRNYYVEAAGPPESDTRFYRVGLKGDSEWRRRAGEEGKPMVATFGEVRASRLKLVVIDYGNPPLDVRGVRFSAPVRQVIVQRPKDVDTSLRLFYGNPDAQAPNYDFARNLPLRLDPAPERVQLGEPQMNPGFVPPPKPLTERWPWLIYVVLASVSLVLAVVIVSLARIAIDKHDRPSDAAGSLVSGEAAGPPTGPTMS